MAREDLPWRAVGENELAGRRDDDDARGIYSGPTVVARQAGNSAESNSARSIARQVRYRVTRAGAPRARASRRDVADASPVSARPTAVGRSPSTPVGAPMTRPGRRHARADVRPQHPRPTSTRPIRPRRSYHPVRAGRATAGEGTQPVSRLSTRRAGKTARRSAVGAARRCAPAAAQVARRNARSTSRRVPRDATSHAAPIPRRRAAPRWPRGAAAAIAELLRPIAGGRSLAARPISLAPRPTGAPACPCARRRSARRPPRRRRTPPAGRRPRRPRRPAPAGRAAGEAAPAPEPPAPPPCPRPEVPSDARPARGPPRERSEPKAAGGTNPAAPAPRSRRRRISARPGRARCP